MMNPAPSTIFYHVSPLKIEEVEDSVSISPAITQNLLNHKEGAGGIELELLLIPKSPKQGRL